MAEKQKVIFRTEYDKYTKQWGYLAIFPDDEANPGYVGAVPFHISKDNRSVIFEPYTEISLDYMYSKKLVNKSDSAIPILKRILEEKFGEEFIVVYKIMRR